MARSKYACGEALSSTRLNAVTHTQGMAALVPLRLSVSCLCGGSRQRGVDIFIHRLRCLSVGWGLRALTNLLSAMQGQKALGPEPLQATTHTEAASRRLCAWCCR